MDREDLAIRMNEPEEGTGAVAKLLTALKAMGHGAADEQTFGLEGKALGKEGKILERRHPGFVAAGRIGSNLIPLPLPSKVKAAVRAPKAAKYVATELPRLVPLLERLGKYGFSTGQHLLGEGAQFIGQQVAKPAEKLAGKFIGQLAGDAASSIATGEGNHLIRKALGTSDDTASPTSTMERLESEAKWGMGLGQLGRLMSKVAPAVYQHRGLMNPYKPKESEDVANEMMKEGTWGSLGGAFKRRAQQFKDEAKPIFDDVQQSVSGGEYRATSALNTMLQLFNPLYSAKGRPIKPAKGMIDTKQLDFHLRKNIGKAKRGFVTPQEQDQMREVFQGAKSGLKPDSHGLTDVDEVQKSLHAANERLSQLKAVDQARRAGVPGLGEGTAELDRVAAGKKAYEKMYERALQEFGAPGDLAKYRGAKTTHAKGADLEKNLFANELMNQKGTGHIFSDAWRNILAQSINSAPIRTGLGVGLDRLGPKVNASLGGRVAEMRTRPRPEDEELAAAADSPEEDGPNPFLEDDAPAPKEEAVPPVDEAARKSGRKLGLTETDLQAVRDPKNPALQREWNALEARRAEKRAKKKADSESEDEDLEEGNPFLD